MATTFTDAGTGTATTGTTWVDESAQIASASQAAVTMAATSTTTALRTDLNEVAVLANALRSALVAAKIIKGAA